MGFCSRCGSRAGAGDRFCAACGSPLDAPVAAPTWVPPPAPSSDASRRFPARAVLVAVGVLGLVTVGGVLLRGLAGEGRGAGSPEGAVEALATSLSEEDLLGALAVLPPEELQNLDDLYDEGAEAAERSGAVESSGDPFAWLDLEVEDLELRVEDVGDDVAKVYVEDGSIDARVEPDETGQLIRRSVDDPSAIDEHLDVSEAVDEIEEEVADGGSVSGIYLMTVRRGGRWHVSPFYTLAEYLREGAGLPPVAFGDPGEEAAGSGSPSDAVEQAVDAAVRVDIRSLLDQAPPEELGALHDYRDALLSYIEEEDLDGSSITLEGLEVSEHRLGAGRVRVDIDELRLRVVDEYGDETDIAVEGPCVRTTEDGEESEECLDEALDIDGLDSVFVVTTEVDGEWFVSPMATLVEYLGTALDAGAVERLAVPAEVRGSLTDDAERLLVGSSASGSLESRFDVAAFDVPTEAGQEITVETSGMDTVLWLYDSDGELVISDDDGAAGDGGSFVSEEVDGPVRVVVTGYSGNTGDFDVEVREGIEAAPDDESFEEDEFLEEDDTEFEGEGVLQVGDFTTGSIAFAGDRASYLLDLSAGEVVTITTAGMDTVVTAYGPDGEYLDEDDDGNGASGGSVLTVSADTSGTYEIVVTGYDTRTGAFTISVD